MLKEFHYIHPTGRIHSGTTHIRAMYWNVWYRSQTRRLDALLHAIQISDCDVLLLQEVLLHMCGHDIPARIAEFGYYGYFVESRAFRGGYREGTAIFSRWPMKTRFVSLRNGGRMPLRGGPESRRCYLEATVETPIQPMTFGVAHLSYVIPTTETKVAVERAMLRDELERHDRRFVFGGDLNARLHPPLTNHIPSSLVHLGPDTRQPSWRPLPNLLPWAGRRLDHVFATPDVSASARFAEQAVSDHRPLVVDIKLDTEALSL